MCYYLAQLLRWEPAPCTFCGPQRNFEIAERSEISSNSEMIWISEVFPRLKFRGLEKLFLFLVDWNWLYIVRIKWQNCQKGSKCALCDFTFSHCKAWKHSDTKWFVVRNISISPILKLGYQFNFGTGFNLHQKQLNFSHLFVTYVSSSLLTIRSSPSSL